MCCGTAENSYKTLDSMRIILADGLVLDTGSNESKEQFRQTHPQLIQEIQEMVAEVKCNEELSARIARKFKNEKYHRIPALMRWSILPIRLR